ncbi:MAG TPA: hypothetical protein VHR88_11040 [Solirubrobacteraceae bacterium]|nr:hypothetical protein [Solirubrobacteraceae bacterium]
MKGRYGAGPLRLLALIASFALAAAALAQFLDTGARVNLLVWVAGAIVGHDLILFPLYAGLDRLAGRIEPRARVPVVNHVRVPAFLSGLLLLVYFPLILDLSAPVYHAATGVGAQVYLGRWLAITAGLFLASAVVYAIRVRRARPRPERARAEVRDDQPCDGDVHRANGATGEDVGAQPPGARDVNERPGP